MIEKARAEDLAAILAISIAGAVGGRAAEESTDPEVYRKAFEEIRACPDIDIYVALDEAGEVIGTYTYLHIRGLAFRGRPRVELESVHVRADQRSKGIGAKMMAHAEARARESGAALIQLTSNKVRVDAHRFYERLGYVQSHFGFKKKLI
ncbi:GNAT family N-acetyltransferase [Roseibium litorale]|uniref:GNAT family N-acetyltransferase n=1 Tax=Roseibium litorale TaxID=2803841 RepID=UPI001AD9213C